MSEAEALIADLQAALDAQAAFGSHLSLLGKVLSTRAWERITVSDSRPFSTFSDLALHPLPSGLGIDTEHKARTIETALLDLCCIEPWVELLERIIAVPGRPRKNTTNGAIIRFYPMPRSPHSRNRLLLRLKSERADLFRRVVAKELSAHRAAVEAGWLEPPSPRSIGCADILQPGVLEQLSDPDKITIFRKIFHLLPSEQGLSECQNLLSSVRQLPGAIVQQSDHSP